MQTDTACCTPCDVRRFRHRVSRPAPASRPPGRSRRASSRILAVVAAAALASVLAPATASAQVPAAAAPARAADVATIDAIIAALYDVISGPVGQARDWDRMRSLFLPGAQLVPTGALPDGGFGHYLLSVDDYIARAGPQLVQRGFREHEIARVLERFGNIAHAFSSYEGFIQDSTEPFVRGVNSIQLWNDGRRWWILTVFWEAERPDNPLPPRYLPGG